MKKLIFILIIISIACCAFAQKIAVIDMQTIYKSEFISNSYQELQAQSLIYENECKIRQDNLFLGENEITDLINLVTNKGDQAKIKEYLDTNSKRYDELQVLNQTKTLTDEQKNRLTELNNLQKKSAENLENKVKTFKENLESIEAKKSEEIETALKEACEKVAKDKKYSAVIIKEAIFFGGDDITKDVIAALPKAK